MLLGSSGTTSAVPSFSNCSLPYHHRLRNHGPITTGHSLGGGAPFIPMKATQWCMKPKMLDLQAGLFCIVYTLCSPDSIFLDFFFY